jgi:uncharacterized membrane protein YhdT
VYLGSLLASSIILFAVVKQFAEKFTASGNKPIVYGTLSSVMASLATYLSTYISENQFTVFCYLAAIFLFFGIIHMVLVHNKYFVSDSNNPTRILLGEIIFGLSIIFFTVLLFSSLQYFVRNNKQFLFFPMMMSAICFFVPILFVHMFDAAFKIPIPDYPTWTYPAHPIDLPDEDPRERVFVIGFFIPKKITDDKPTYFTAKAPENFYFGDLYYFFINDYNEEKSETPVIYANENGEPHRWVFRLKRKWWFQKPIVLNPSLSVKDNGLKENSIIFCERV